MSRVASVEHLESTISGGISSQMGDKGICGKSDVMSSSNIHISQVTKIVLTKNIHISILQMQDYGSLNHLDILYKSVH